MATSTYNTAPRAARPLRPLLGSRDPQRIPLGHALNMLLASLFLCLMTLVFQVNVLILLVFVACTFWRFLAERKGWRLPSMLVRLLVFAPAVSAVVVLYGLEPTAGSLMALLIVLMALKILELRTTRDFVVVAVLGYFMILSALFYNQNFALFLYMVPVIVLNTMAMISVHQGAGKDTVWPSLRLAGGLLLQAAPLMVLSFIIFPRVQLNFLRRLTNPNGGTSGMSDSLHPGSIESLALSSETAFRVKFASGQKFSTPDLYWRGLVLARCEAPLSWRAAYNEAQDQRDSNKPAPASSIEQSITVMPQNERWLFALDRPVHVVNSGVHPLLYANTQEIRSERPLYSKAIYTVFSRPGTLPADALSERARKFYTLVPPGVSPRVNELVQGWKTRGASPAAVVLTAQEFFRDGGYTYTLEPGQLPPSTALDTFLFNTKTGFCEHYAAAFCTLMRVAGIPSRVIVGYQGGELNILTGFYTIRQSDAHAWSEVWSEKTGWQRVDPTALVAPGRVTMGANAFADSDQSDGLASRLRLGRFGSIGWVRWITHNANMVWEGLDQQWNLMVIGYDPDQQFAFFAQLGLANVSWLVGVALSLAGIFSCLLLAALFMRLAQGIASARKRGWDDEIRAAYARFCQRVSVATGVARDSAEGPLAYAARAGNECPDLTADIRRVTDAYVRLRYLPADKDSLANNESRQAFLSAARHFRPAPRARAVSRV